MSVVERRSNRRSVVDDVRLSVGVEEERRIDAVDFRKPNRIGPWARGIFRRDEEIAAAVDESRDHIVCARILTDHGCKDATRDAGTVDVQLRWSVEDVPDLRPVHEVLAAKDRNTGEIHEARVDDVVVVTDSRDAGGGVESGEDG